jgi:hypothetical protein
MTIAETLSPPATSPPGWPAALDKAAFHGLAGEVVHAIDPHTEADPAAILLQFLIGYGSLVGRHAHFVAENDLHHTNLFAVLVGETAKGRKGTSWGRVRHLLELIDQQWAATRVVAGLSSGEGLIYEVRDAVYKLEKDEMVMKDAGVHDKRLLVYESEFSTVLKQASREKNILAAVIRQAWDSGYLRNMVVQQPRRATDAHIAIVGHITRHELLRQISDTDAANGFGNRFLWACVRRSKTLPDGGGQPDFGDLVPRLCESVKFVRGMGEIRRDEEARKLWHAVYRDLSEGKPGLLGGMVGRAESQAMRLAVVYAALDRSQTIREPHLEAGLAVWQYAEDSARYIFGERLGDPTADAILAALRAAPRGLTRTEIANQVLGKHKPAQEIGRALEVLRVAGLACMETIETEGRPAELWRAAR